MRKNTWKFRAFIIGICLWIISGAIITIKNQFKMEKLSSSYPDGKFFSSGELIINREIIEVAIETPLKMMVNDSYHFTATFKSKVPVVLNNYIIEDFSLYLRGAAFNIEPSNGFKIKAKTKFPIVQTWSVAPTTAGEHELVLDFSESPWLISMVIKYLIKKSKQEPLKKLAHEKGAIVIPVSVRSLFGLKPNTITLLQYLFSFIGFILMWPGLMWIIEKLKRKK